MTILHLFSVARESSSTVWLNLVSWYDRYTPASVDSYISLGELQHSPKKTRIKFHHSPGWSTVEKVELYSFAFNPNEKPLQHKSFIKAFTFSIFHLLSWNPSNKYCILSGWILPFCQQEGYWFTTFDKYNFLGNNISL